MYFRLHIDRGCDHRSPQLVYGGMSAVYLDILCLPTAPANVYPPLRLRLYNLHLLINQLHQRCARCILPEHLIADFQQQFVDVQLDRAGTYTPLHDFFGKVVCAVQRNQHTIVDLLVDGLEAIKVDLPLSGARGPIVAVHVAD